MRREACETILYNGKIVSVDKDFSIAEAVAIGGGKFLRVGKNAEVRTLADNETKEIDLKGKMVVPGFIDTHPHMIHASAGRTTTVPLMGLRSIEAIKKRIAEWVEKTPSGKWILTTPVGDPPYFFNVPDILEERRWPTRADLDEVSPDNPVYIQPFYSRVPSTAIANSYGLKLMGVTKDTPSEERGVMIVKEPETGEPNGQLHGMQLIYNFSPMFGKLMSALPRLTLEDMVYNLRATIKNFNAAGVTTVYEGHAVCPEEHLLPLKELWSTDELTVRVYYAYEIDTTKSLDEIERWIKDLAHATGQGFGDDRVKICGATVSLDGPIWHGCAVMKKPYLDPYGKLTTPSFLVPPEKFKEIALIAARNNLRMNSCFGGDKSADLTLQVFEEVNKEVSINDRRWVIQHIQFPSQENIEKCKELGLSVTICTNFEWGKGTECYIGRLGKEFATKPMPLRRWLDAGVPIAQSTDFGPYMPMFTIWQSLKRIHGLTGESFAGPDQKITREEALRIYTINAAQVLFWEDKLGSIEDGKLADLVVLDNDILTCPLDEIKDTKVLMTMVGGQIVYEERG